jgi:hypothetical protein
MDKASADAQDFISRKISKLRHEGYPQEQAIAIAHEYARKEGYAVARKSEGEIVNELTRENNVTRANQALLAHQLGLFKAEPQGDPLLKYGPGGGYAKPSSPQAAQAMAKQPIMAGGMVRAEELTETETEEEVEKAGEFKSKQVQSMRQAKGFTRARPQVKDEISELSGKGRVEGDPKNAVLNKDK